MAKILIVCNHHATASGRYMTDAFKRLGHDVRTAGNPKGNQIWGLTIPDKYIWEPDYPYPTDISNALKWVASWKPDLVLQTDTELTISNNLFPDTLHAIYTVDNHCRNVNYMLWDKRFLAHHDGPAQPVCEDCDDVWLPCAYDPQWFTPSPIPMHDRAYDVCMIGVGYERRVKIITAMADAGLKVYANTGLLYKEYAEVYQNSRISLCVSACGDVAQRIFEGAAMGCALLTDKCADFDRLGFNHMQHGVVYDSDANAVSAAINLINSPKELKRIASEGQAWARPNTWDARAKTILETMGLS